MTQKAIKIDNNGDTKVRPIDNNFNVANYVNGCMDNLSKVGEKVSIELLNFKKKEMEQLFSALQLAAAAQNAVSDSYEVLIRMESEYPLIGSYATKGGIYGVLVGGGGASIYCLAATAPLAAPVLLILGGVVVGALVGAAVGAIIGAIAKRKKMIVLTVNNKDKKTVDIEVLDAKIQKA